MEDIENERRNQVNEIVAYLKKTSSCKNNKVKYKIDDDPFMPEIILYDVKKTMMGYDNCINVITKCNEIDLINKYSELQITFRYKNKEFKFAISITLKDTNYICKQEKNKLYIMLISATNTFDDF